MKRYIFLPWNSPRDASTTASHWSLIVLEPKALRLRLYDSLSIKKPCPRGLRAWAKNTVSGWLDIPDEEWQFAATRAAAQPDGATSSVYVFAHTHALAKGLGVEIRNDIDTMEILGLDSIAFPLYLDLANQGSQGSMVTQRLTG